MIIEYNGKSINTKHYIEISQEEQQALQKAFFAKPPFDIVAKQLKKISKDGVASDKISHYYFQDLMAKTLVETSKWTVEEVFESKELLGFFKAKVLSNEKVFLKTDSLLRNITVAIRLGGKHYAKMPTNYPIRSVKNILSKYNINNNYYDFSCGWGSRLLGALSLQINYFGTDPNYLLVDRLYELTNDYKSIIKNNSIVDIRKHGSEIFIPEFENKMGLIFSSPPYYNLEDYKIGNQSYKPGITYNQWVSNFLTPTITNCYKYLISNGYFCINVKNFNSYHLIESCKQICDSLGLIFITNETLTNIKRVTPTGEISNKEDILIFKK